MDGKADLEAFLAAWVFHTDALLRSPQKEEKIRKLQEAFNTLRASFGNSYKDHNIYSLLLYANVIQDLTNCGWVCPEELASEKKQIFLMALELFIAKDGDFADGARHILGRAFRQLGSSLLSGADGLAQDDKLARDCYICLNKLHICDGYVFLDDFKQNEAGEWVYIGTRPDPNRIIPFC